MCKNHTGKLLRSDFLCPFNVVRKKDQWVWLPHDEYGFVPAKLLAQKHQYHRFETIYKESVVLPSSDQLNNLPPATANAFFNDLNDLIHLEDFSEGLHRTVLKFTLSSHSPARQTSQALKSGGYREHCHVGGGRGRESFPFCSQFLGVRIGLKVITARH